MPRGKQHSVTKFHVDGTEKQRSKRGSEKMSSEQLYTRVKLSDKSVSYSDASRDSF